MFLFSCEGSLDHPDGMTHQRQEDLKGRIQTVVTQEATRFGCDIVAVNTMVRDADIVEDKGDDTEGSTEGTPSEDREVLQDRGRAVPRTRNA